MSAQTLTFRPRKQQIDADAIVESSADILGRTLVRMAVEGKDGDLYATLRTIDPSAANAAIDEIVCLYLFVADRSISGLLDDAILSEFHRDAFSARLFERAADHIAAASDPSRILEVRARLSELWERRRAEYGGCSRMYRHENESLDGTVIFAFYRNALQLGRETALHVLAALEIPLLHVELSRILGETICELLGMDA